MAKLRGAFDPIGMQVRFGERFIDPGLIGAERAPALEQQSDAFERRPVGQPVRLGAQGARSRAGVNFGKPIPPRALNALGPAPDFGFFRLSYRNFLHHLLGGRQQCVGLACHALLHASAGRGGHHSVPRAFRSGALDNRSRPVNGRLSSKIRKIAPAADNANSEREVRAVTFRGENKLKLANMITSQNARIDRNGVGIGFRIRQTAKNGIVRDRC